ncbi:MAG: CDP-alcohol phosphatidyltransferase family protein [Bacteroidales bacterium]|jgi:CDP-diacylglycerol--serine O-phosphatidyltransferase|nr:CDP-alcohol phosphatidyltransferase family protein [Bacteroidales bacterium]
MKKQLPNIITLMNFSCGVMSIIALLLWNNSLLASMFIVFGAIFDFFDGMTARLLKVSSNIGKELDSLADIVTFGVAPSMIATNLLLIQSPNYPFLQIFHRIVCYIPLVMAVMSCYRLAKFNIDTRQTSSFIGLPTPANALVWISIPVISYCAFNDTYLWGVYSPKIYNCFAIFLNNPFFVIVSSIIFAILLICELPLFALKFKNLKWQDNKIKFIFLSVSIVMIFLFSCYAIPLIIIIYIVISIINNIIKHNKTDEI